MVVVSWNVLCPFSFYHNQEFLCRGGCRSRTQTHVVHCISLWSSTAFFGAVIQVTSSRPELTWSHHSFVVPQREVSVSRKQLQLWSLRADIAPTRLWLPLETYCWDLFLWHRPHCLYHLCFMPETSHHHQKSNVVILAQFFFNYYYFLLQYVRAIPWPPGFSSQLQLWSPQWAGRAFILSLWLMNKEKASLLLVCGWTDTFLQLPLLQCHI